MDIVYNDCLPLGGYKYALLLVNVATQYAWVYGLSSINSAAIVDSLDSFRTNADGVAKTFHTDFNKRLIGGKALQLIK